MEYYCGIDVSLEQSSVCVVDGTGWILRETTVASDPDALIMWFSELGLQGGFKRSSQHGLLYLIAGTDPGPLLASSNQGSCGALY